MTELELFTQYLVVKIGVLYTFVRAHLSMIDLVIKATMEKQYPSATITTTPSVIVIYESGLANDAFEFNVILPGGE